MLHRVRTAMFCVVCILLPLLVSGCAEMAQAQAEADARQQEDVRAQGQAIFDNIDRQCENYGFRRGTDGFAGCRERGRREAIAKIDKQIQQQKAADQTRNPYCKSPWGGVVRCSDLPKPTTNTECEPGNNGRYSCTTY